jgi:phage-related protein
MATYSVTIRRDEVSDDTTFYTNITDTTLLDSIFGDVNPQGSDTVEYAFDRGIARTAEHNTFVAKFGDGYEQRLRSGINSKQESISVNFNNRNADDIVILSAFLDNKVGANFDIVLNGETIKVATEQYNISYQQDEIHSLNTTLRRVYEP